MEPPEQPYDSREPGRTSASPPPRRWPSPLWLSVVCIGILLLAVAAWLMPSRNRDHVEVNRLKCVNNLRQIALASLMYANDHQGHFPPTFELILSKTDLTSEVFVCPSTRDTRAPGNTKEQMVEHLTSGGHLSYIYCGEGLTTRDYDRGGGVYVVAVEPLGNHHNDGTNVAFDDGHVEWFNRDVAQPIYDQINSGTRPVRWPPLESAEPKGPPRGP